MQAEKTKQGGDDDHGDVHIIDAKRKRGEDSAGRAPTANSTAATPPRGGGLSPPNEYAHNDEKKSKNGHIIITRNIAGCTEGYVEHTLQTGGGEGV